MSALAYTSPPSAVPVRRRHVGLDLTLRWGGSQEALATELRARLEATHVRLERLAVVGHRSFACRLLLSVPEAHLTHAGVLEVLGALDGLAPWTALRVLEELDGRPAFDEVPS